MDTRQAAQRWAALQPVEPLTDREEEILAVAAQGLTNSEIADKLYIALSTVKTHIASLMAKLGARNRVEIAMWAYETNRVHNRSGPGSDRR
jgi:DNA-binding NarL/FixJ family response regulator